MRERPTPSLDRVQDALREHDENAEDAAPGREGGGETAPEPPEDEDDSRSGEPRG